VALCHSFWNLLFFYNHSYNTITFRSSSPFAEARLHCWVIWKVAELPPPPPHSGASFWRPILVFGRLSLAFPHVGESPNLGATQGGGGGLGWPSWGLSPKHKELVFCLFLLNYMTSGPFSWCCILLLRQRFFLYYFSRKVMPNLCCVAQKAASAAQLRFENNFLCRGSCFLATQQRIAIN